MPNMTERLQCYFGRNGYRWDSSVYYNLKDAYTSNHREKPVIGYDKPNSIEVKRNIRLKYLLNPR